MQWLNLYTLLQIEHYQERNRFYNNIFNTFQVLPSSMERNFQMTTSPPAIQKGVITWISKIIWEDVWFSQISSRPICFLKKCIFNNEDTSEHPLINESILKYIPSALDARCSPAKIQKSWWIFKFTKKNFNMEEKTIFFA